MRRLVNEEEYHVDITALEEDNVVLLDAEHQLGCTVEVYDVLVEFFNMGIDNCLKNADHLYIPENVVEEDIMELFWQIGFAYKTIGGYFPSMLWGIHGMELCHTVAQVIEANKIPTARTVA